MLLRGILLSVMNSLLPTTSSWMNIKELIHCLPPVMWKKVRPQLCQVLS